MDRVDYQPLVVQDLINLYRSEELDINPWYQRRSVWNRPQKAYLINTLFEQKPIPAIYIRHSLDLEKEKSIREVVDGQQRIRTLLEFHQNEFSARHPEHEKRVRFQDLTSGQRQKFLLTALSIGYLLGADDADVIDIFGRINSVSKSLNPQEKRNANFSGEFKQFCMQQASSRISFWRNYDIFTANDIARMNEVQFVSDLSLNMIKGLSDFSSAKLNRIYKEFDENFEIWGEMNGRFDRIFDFIAGLEPSILRDTIFSRQPVFFSLVLVIDGLKRLSAKKISEALFEIDARFHSDVPIAERPKEDVAFRQACSASTQRISQRRVRRDYIVSFVK